jgi:diguanylate cyclase (GGDEF)-like protein
MDYQEFVDHIEPMTCVISVEKFSDGSYGNIRLVAGNKAYVDSIENPDNVSSNQMLNNKFVPNSPYENYIPKDLNFEAAIYSCALMKKPFHTYIHPERYSFWIDMYMMPLASPDPNVGYCTYTQEFTMEKNSERMSNISADISSAVLKTSLKLKGAKDFANTMDEVLSDIREICSADRCCILLTDYKERKCSVLCQSIAPELDIIPMEEHIANDFDDFFDVVDTWQGTIAGSTCLIIKNESDMNVLKERNPLWHTSLKKADVDSLVLFPLEYNDEILGYIWAVNFNTENATNIKEVLELTTHLIASEIANYQLVDRLRIMGTVDMLTGVYNRNAMNNRVDWFIRSSDKKPETFGIIFADLNGLKQKNDNEGHGAGDRLLKAAAAVLEDVFYDGEIYRAGGDEFMIIDCEAEESDLEARVEKLRRDSEDPENISFALGCYFDSGEGDIRKAMRAADERMYKDKERYYALFPDRKRK